LSAKAAEKRWLQIILKSMSKKFILGIDFKLFFGRGRI
jgi:hypothetical protein